MFFYKYSDGTWNDGNVGLDTDRREKLFICEWDYFNIWV